MSLIETGAVVLIAGMLVAISGTTWHRVTRTAELSTDFSVVREAALDYAALRCGALPPTPTGLTDVLTELGRTGAVAEPGRWSVALTARPGWTQPGALPTAPAIAMDLLPIVRIRYTAVPDDWEAVHLANRYTGVREPAFVTLVVSRRRVSRPAGSFQLLLERRQC